MRYAVLQLTVLLSLFFGLLAPSLAANPSDTVVGVLASTPAQFALLQRLSRAVDHENGLRILPMAGKGPVTTLSDLLELKGIDAALVSSDAMAFMSRNGLATDLDGKLTLIVRLSALDIHVIARQGINSLSDLAGKTVVMGPTSSDSYVAGYFLFAASGIAAKLVEANAADSIRAVAGGSADAAILVGRKPMAELAALIPESGIHLLQVTAPGGLEDTYAPSLITANDYPKLVSAEQPVETISASLVIAAVNWKRGSPQYAKLKRLAEQLFNALQPGGSSDASLNLAASVPGWKRHPSAEDALASHAKRLQTVIESNSE